ncbi:DUF2169 domain-containing protein [Inquilinus sp. CA228]|uniref:DUF2169 domain-containing protein n=1 Tax=Inquilinus sp. CA228 TaxID=3455609 RepID=UPI003F8CFDDB
MTINATPPLQTGSVVGRYRREDHLLTIITTMRAHLVAGGVYAPLPIEDQPEPRGLMSHDDGQGNSPIHGGDIVPHKPRADFTLLGSCHAPAGRSVTSLDVTIGMGEWRKSLRVFGDSDWGKGFGTIGAEPDSRLPIANIHPHDALHTTPDIASIAMEIREHGVTVSQIGLNRDNATTIARDVKLTGDGNECKRRKARRMITNVHLPSCADPAISGFGLLAPRTVLHG